MYRVNINELKSNFKKGHFFWGNTKEFASGTLAFIQGLQKEYGDGIVACKIAFKNFYFLLSTKSIVHVLQKNNKNYRRSFAYNGLRDFLGNGLLTNDSNTWVEQRRKIQPAFSKKELQKMSAIMWQGIHKTISEYNPNAAFNCTEQMNKITMRVVSDALFGATDLKGLEALNGALYVLRKHANDKLKNPLKAPLWVPNKANKRFNKAKSEIKEVLSNILSATDANNQDNLLYWLRNPAEGQPMPVAQLLDELTTLFIAGQETTAQSLCFTLYLLGRHPDALKKVKTELDGLAEFNEQGVHQLAYLSCVIKESMRLYPPAWAMSREVIEEDTIDGVTIPKGSVVFLSIYAMHRNPDTWEEPEAFKPERFAGSKKDPEGYLPFGLGPRMCVGNHFAVLEMKMILAQFLKKFEFELKNPEPIELITPMTMSPKEDIWLQLNYRSITSEVPQ